MPFRVAESLGRRSSRLVTAREVAEHLSVDAAFVYEHVVELGARRLGDGPKARLRFSLSEVDERLGSCSGSRGSQAADPAPALDSGLRRRRQSGTAFDLLPIRGEIRRLPDVGSAA